MWLSIYIVILLRDHFASLHNTFQVGLNCQTVTLVSKSRKIFLFIADEAVTRYGFEEALFLPFLCNTGKKFEQS